MRKFTKGNDAVVIGALYAGCDVYFGYPITPASEIARARRNCSPSWARNISRRNARPPPSTCSTARPAAGKLAMTASSGPGISLMQEGISYMAGAQLPALIVNVMRAGPGLGNIGPEQGDYNQAVKGGGHGNYHAIVLRPASVQEMCDLTMKAFELAFKYRNPAMILADATLGQVKESLKLPEKEATRPETSSWSVQGDAATRKNLISSIYLDLELMEKHNQLLQQKYAAMEKEAMSESYLTDDAGLVITGYGTSARVARSAVDQLRKEGVRAGLFRPISLMPFPTRAAEPGRSRQEGAGGGDEQWPIPGRRAAAPGPGQENRRSGWSTAWAAS